MPEPEGHVVRLDDLEHTAHAHEFVGAEHGDVPFSIILVHSQPGVGPKLHRHPYAEVFVVEAGQATFRIGDRTLVIDEGHVVVSPPGEAHGFTNTGRGRAPPRRASTARAAVRHRMARTGPIRPGPRDRRTRERSPRRGGAGARIAILETLGVTLSGCASTARSSLGENPQSLAASG